MLGVLKKEKRKKHILEFFQSTFFDSKSEGDAAHPPSTSKVPQTSSSRSQLRHEGLPKEYPNKETSKGFFFFLNFRSQITCSDILDNTLYV